MGFAYSGPGEVSDSERQMALTAFDAGVKHGEDIFTEYVETCPHDNTSGFREIVDMTVSERTRMKDDIKGASPGDEEYHLEAIAGVLKGMENGANVFGHKEDARYASEALERMGTELYIEV